MKLIDDLIDSLRPDPHKILADGASLFLAGMKEWDDQETCDFRNDHERVTKERAFASKGSGKTVTQRPKPITTTAIR